ncbi:serine hydrolase domain-containing protein [Abyssibius alkaniclasticus]|uniref:serine hydrolase domain-containing protein n=1 Tax=Abyssibius alkaniclasticus TaxID=2881234 RepID=UPI004059A9A6
MRRIKQIFILIVLVLVVLLTFNWGRISRLVAVVTLFDEDRIVANFSQMDAAFESAPLLTGNAQPLPEAPAPLPESFAFNGQDVPLQAWLEDSSYTGLVVLKDGAIAHESYALGTGPDDVRISWSVAKSFLSALFGILVDEGTIPDLNAPVTDFVPALVGSAYDGARIIDVLQMSSGVAFNEDYLDFWSDINKMGRVLALGWSMDGFAAALNGSAHAPGSARQYTSIDTHVLGMVIRGATGRSVVDLMGEKLLAPIGLEGPAYYLTDGYGVAFVLGGLNMRTRDYARFGLLFANQGRLGARQLVPAEWVAASTRNSAPRDITGDPRGYGYQWWLPADAQPGEFFAAGIYGQYIYVDQMRGVVIALNAADRNFRDESRDAMNRNIAMFRAIAAGLE